MTEKQSPAEVIIEVAERALELAAHRSAQPVRENTMLGMGAPERALVYGIVGAILEQTGAIKPIDTTDPDVQVPSYEEQRLQAENEALRKQLAGPFATDAPDVEADKAEADATAAAVAADAPAEKPKAATKA